jgi:chemotaxis protein MotB
MTEDGQGSSGVPEWFVTYADMMSLLLTFFIMLVSFSELKSEEKYQALMDAFQEQFGQHDSHKRVIPGEVRPRNSVLSKLASLGRAKRLGAMQAGAKVQSPAGDSALVTMVRSGKKTTIGTVLYFQEEQIDLDDSQRAILGQLAETARGKPQKIEIRGHTSYRPTQSTTHVRDNWDLSFERCRRVMHYLVEEQQIDLHRLRISAAASNEPIHIGTNSEKLQQNPRVEVYLLDEVVNDTVGTEQEQQQRFVETPGTATGSPEKQVPKQ